MTIREARCACGALSARAEGDPVRASICHCLDCKRRSGSAFSWNATYDAARVAIDAGAFADPGFPPPAVEVYEERRCLWLPELGIPREP